MANIYEPQLDNIDWANQYFQREHFLAFLPNKWEMGSEKINRERIAVGDMLYDIHKDIFPQFSNYNLLNLYHHEYNEHIVSSPVHKMGFTTKKLSAMWLSYGKSPRTLKAYYKDFYGSAKTKLEGDKNLQSFMNHARLQLIIRMEEMPPRRFEIGVWLVFGKDNDGSFYDRRFFHAQMKNPKYQEEFYSHLQSLAAKDYWISVGKTDKPISDFDNAQSLYETIQDDTPQKYFIIGKTYLPGSEEISSKNIDQTILTGFQELYPVYNFMRDKKFE